MNLNASRGPHVHLSMEKGGAPLWGIWIAALLAFAVAAAAPATPRSIKRLDVDVETPVYTLTGDLPLREGPQHYLLSWAGIPVARAQVTMRRETPARDIAVEVFGATHPVIDWLWRYRIEGRGVVRTRPFAPGGLIVDECENREHQRTEIYFAEEGDGVRGVRHRHHRVREYVFESKNTFDIASSALLVLNLDYAPGARFALDTFTGKSRYRVDIEVQERESVRLGEQAFDAWRLRVLTEELTDDDPEGRHRETYAWVTTEAPRQLLRASSQTFVGSISVELDPAGVPQEADRGARCT